MKISIHQPNFMPWYPFFQKISEVDRFIILSHCQFEKNNYQNRFNIGSKWYTLSVKKGLENIVKKEYVNPKKDWNIIKINLKEYKNVLSLFDDYIYTNLNKTNILIIIKICKLLDIKTEIVYDYDTDLKGTDRLVDLVKYYGGDSYLSGISGKKYLEMEKFKKNNINLIFQDDSKMIKQPIIETLKNLK